MRHGFPHGGRLVRAVTACVRAFVWTVVPCRVERYTLLAHAAACRVPTAIGVVRGGGRHVTTHQRQKPGARAQGPGTRQAVAVVCRV